MRLLACLLAMGLLGHDSRPQPAPPVFVSADKWLTFRTPAGASHCPLPDDWVGSDHGTTLFLSPPSTCGGTGYASSARNFRGDPALISVYYGFWFDSILPPPCSFAGTATLFGKSQTICNADSDGKIVRTVYTRYSKDGGRELSVTLVTNLLRVEQDVATLRQFLATFRICSTTYRAEGKVQTWGEGPPCPKGGIF